MEIIRLSQCWVGCRGGC